MRIFKFEELNSTNIFLRELQEKKNYDIVIAETQTLGKGRRGNKWSSEKGGAYFSFLVEEDKNISLEEYSRLPLVIGYSLLKTFEELEPELEFKFKWTNDIYINDKKISGILVEKMKDFFIVGIGINVNNEIKGEAENRAISMGKLTSKKYNIEEIIISVVENIKKDLNFYFSGCWESILAELNKKNYLYNKEINVFLGEGNSRKGTAGEIHKSGQLVVNIDNKDMLFNVGEIHITKNN